MKENLRQKHRVTREVKVGCIGIGGVNPIRIQSMITTPLKEIEKAAAEVISLYENGCEIVRVAIQNKNDIKQCEELKNTLYKRLGSSIPLVADVHFYPPAAILVADFVEKVRINPGNFVQLQNDDGASEKIEEKLFPLIDKCKKLKRAVRIGVNHGSLSPHILTKFGRGEEGMLEMLFEYVSIFRKYDFHDLVFSMKTSNALDLVAVYKKLNLELKRRNWNYPLHVGLTEGGEGIQGRIKSAMSIGRLLAEGIGETIRVSITEPSLNEISVCKAVIARSKKIKLDVNFRGAIPERRQTKVALYTNEENFKDYRVDYYIYKGDEGEFILTKENERYPLLSLETSLNNNNDCALLVNCFDEASWERIIEIKPKVIFASRKCGLFKFYELFCKKKLNIPLLIYLDYANDDNLLFNFAIEGGYYLSEGIGDGVVIKTDTKSEHLLEMTLNLLQCCEMGKFMTDFISCPGCGRTLYNIEEVCKQLKSKMGHLAGLKIAIMGCIVNGIGEVGESDFGYVGVQEKKIDLFVKAQCKKRGVDPENAVDELMALIKENGLWREK